MNYLLFRRNVGEKEWNRVIKGEIDYITTVLKLNLDSPELKGREYKIVPVE